MSSRGNISQAAILTKEEGCWVLFIRGKDICRLCGCEGIGYFGGSMGMMMKGVSQRVVVVGQLGLEVDLVHRDEVQGADGVELCIANKVHVSPRYRTSLRMGPGFTIEHLLQLSRQFWLRCIAQLS